MERIRAFVESYYRDNFSDSFAYHNFRHTESVVLEVQLIADSCGVGANQKEQLIIAAMFHDIGYSQNPDRHEEIGADIAEIFLTDLGEDTTSIVTIKSLIQATYYPYSPKNRSEEIIRDADLAYLGTVEFWKGSDSLRIEWEKVKGLKFTESEWLRINATFLLAHKFYTPCAKERLEPGKKKNLNEVLLRLAEAEKMK